MPQESSASTTPRSSGTGSEPAPDLPRAENAAAAPCRLRRSRYPHACLRSHAFHAFIADMERWDVPVTLLHNWPFLKRPNGSRRSSPMSSTTRASSSTTAPANPNASCARPCRSENSRSSFLTDAFGLWGLYDSAPISSAAPSSAFSMAGSPTAIATPLAPMKREARRPRNTRRIYPGVRLEHADPRRPLCAERELLLFVDVQTSPLNATAPSSRTWP